MRSTKAQIGLAAILLLLSVRSVAAANVACPTESLAYYQSNFTSLSPCTQGDLIFLNFAFQKTTVAGSISASDIMITPNGVDGLSFFAPLFNGTFPSLERYAIGYTADPAPILAGDELSLDPPQGGITVSKYSCADDLLTFGNINDPSTYKCVVKNTSPFALTVSPQNLSASLSYPFPATFVTALMIIELQGTVSGLEGILSDNTLVPEPATFSMLCGALLAGLAFGRRRKPPL